MHWMIGRAHPEQIMGKIGHALSAEIAAQFDHHPIRSRMTKRARRVKGMGSDRRDLLWHS